MYCIRTGSKGKALYTVQVPSFIAGHDYDEGLLWMEMAGAEQACRAIWAYLVKKRTERKPTKLAGISVREGMQIHNIYIDPTIKYYSAVTTHGLVVFHQDFSRLSGRLMLGGDWSIPSPWFQASFQKLVSVPFLPEWIPALWKCGIENELITEPKTVIGPVRVWKLVSNYDKWARLVRNIVREGKWQD